MTHAAMCELAVIRRSAEASKILAHVHPLAFHSFEWDAKYHAIGAYRVRGGIVIRLKVDTFYVRMPETAEGLWLATYGSDNAARIVHERYSVLPPVLASLVEQAAQATTEEY